MGGRDRPTGPRRMIPSSVKPEWLGGASESEILTGFARRSGLSGIVREPRVVTTVSNYSLQSVALAVASRGTGPTGPSVLDRAGWFPQA